MGVFALRAPYRSLQMQIIGRLKGLAGVLPEEWFSIGVSLRPGEDVLFFLAGTSCINLIRLLIKLCEAISKIYHRDVPPQSRRTTSTLPQM